MPISPDIVGLGKTMDSELCNNLQCNFTRASVKRVIMWDIPVNKAPKIDGYNSDFYKATWEIVGEEVADAALDFFSSCRILKELNISSLTLVPK